MLLTTLLLSTAALAGSGPWVVGDDATSIYLGAYAQTWADVADSAGSFDADGITELPTEISSIGLTGVVTYGLLPRLEAELAVPWILSQASRPDAEVCSTFGQDACESVQSIGVVRGRTKALLLDEIDGPPVSLAVGGELRLGSLTSSQRARFTAVGEGTTDMGAFIDIGRTGGFGDHGNWSVYTEVGGRFRSAHTDLDDVPAPGSEFFGEVETFFGRQGTFSIGPGMSWLYRPTGLDLETVRTDYLDDIDRFSVLKVKQIQAGLKVIVFSGNGRDLVVGVLRTVYAENNPSDTLIVSAGMGLRP